MDPALCRAVAARPADWSPVETDCALCSMAPFADEALEAALTSALADGGLSLAGPLRMIRHRGGEHGLPKGEGLGLLLDLTEGRSYHGGLVLTGDAPLTGWRPEAGSITLFDAGAPPLLSLVTGAAPAPRVAVLATVAVL